MIVIAMATIKDVLGHIMRTFVVSETLMISQEVIRVQSKSCNSVM